MYDQNSCLHCICWFKYYTNLGFEYLNLKWIFIREARTDQRRTLGSSSTLISNHMSSTPNLVLRTDWKNRYLKEGSPNNWSISHEYYHGGDLSRKNNSNQKPLRQFNFSNYLTYSCGTYLFLLFSFFLLSTYLNGFSIKLMKDFFVSFKLLRSIN